MTEPILTQGQITALRAIAIEPSSANESGELFHPLNTASLDSLVYIGYAEKREDERYEITVDGRRHLDG